MIRVRRIKGNSNYRNYFKQSQAETKDLHLRLKKEGVEEYRHYMNENGFKRDLDGQKIVLAKIEGRLAERFGIQGEANDLSLDRFFDVVEGKDPDTGESLFKHELKEPSYEWYYQFEENGRKVSFILDDDEVKEGKCRRKGNTYEIDKNLLTKKYEFKQFNIQYEYEHNGQIFAVDEEILQRGLEEKKIKLDGKFSTFKQEKVRRKIEIQDASGQKKFITMEPHETIKDVAKRIESPWTIAYATKYRTSQQLDTIKSNSPIFNRKINEGTVLRHGVARYQFEQGKSLSYYVEIEKDGQKTMLWGMGLKDVIQANNIKVGDYIGLEKGKAEDQPVTDYFAPLQLQGEKNGELRRDVSNDGRATTGSGTRDTDSTSGSSATSTTGLTDQSYLDLSRENQRRTYELGSGGQVAAGGQFLQDVSSIPMVCSPESSSLLLSGAKSDDLGSSGNRDNDVSGAKTKGLKKTVKNPWVLLKQDDLTAFHNKKDEAILAKQKKEQPLYSSSELVEVSRRGAGMEIVNSTPKGISYLMNSTLADEATRAKIISLFSEITTEWVKKQVVDNATARTGKGGLGPAVDIDIGMYQQMHLTTRANEALAHNHIWISPTGVDKNGEFRALDTKAFYQAINGKYGLKHKELDVYIMNDFFHKVRTELGLNLRVIKNNHDQVIGVDIDYSDEKLNTWVDSQETMSKMIDTEIKKIVEKEWDLLEEKVAKFKLDYNILDDKAKEVVIFRDGLEEKFREFQLTTETAKYRDEVHKRIKPEKADLKIHELEGNWEKQMLEAGFSKSNIINKGKDGLGIINGQPKIDINKMLEEILDKQICFAKEEFIDTYARATMGRVSTEEMKAEVDRILLDKGLIVEIEEGIYTSVAKLKAHKEIIFTQGKTMIEAKQEQYVSEVSLVDDFIKSYEESKTTKERAFKFSEDQVNTIKDITTKDGILSLVNGAPGAGKSTMLDAVKVHYENNGMRILGASPTNKVTADMRKTIKESYTIDALLKKIENGKMVLDSKTVLAVDEAGMIGLEKMARLVEACNNAQTKLILIGDVGQIASVQAGNPFGTLQEIAEDKVSRLTTIIRQKNELHLDIAKTVSGVSTFEQMLKDGKSLKEANLAMDKLLESGIFANDALVKVEENSLIEFKDKREEMLSSIVDEYIEKLDLTSREKCKEVMKESLILSGTNKTVDELNNVIRQKLREANIIGEKDYDIKNKKYGNFSLADGEYVIITSKIKGKEQIQNGELGFIEKIERDQQGMLFINLVMNDGSKKSITVNSKEGDRAEVEIRPAYAITYHKSQGTTVDSSIIVLEQGSASVVNGQTLNVAMTRHRHKAKYFSLGREWNRTKNQLCRDGRNENLSLDKEALNELAKQVESSKIEIPQLVPPTLSTSDISLDKAVIELELFEKRIHKDLESYVSDCDDEELKTLITDKIQNKKTKEIAEALEKHQRERLATQVTKTKEHKKIKSLMKLRVVMKEYKRLEKLAIDEKNRREEQIKKNELKKKIYLNDENKPNSINKPKIG